ncbi:MAG TPA: hypothetical protein VFX86_01335 [Candidatus Saccharimonadales bacterium]|nr:hypothetical protein [Candidatus Saccharimonadales bacterium]
MTKPINTESIEKATGKSWDEWLKFFDQIGAKDLTHKEIAQKVHEAGTPGWWAQSVTVAYEQHIGRRVPGQRQDGKFDASASKMIDGTMDEALDVWLGAVKNKNEFDGVAVKGEARVSKTEKWRNWRCDLADGSRIVVGINQKTPDKAGLGLAQEKLESAEQAESKRAFWKEFLTRIR